jgi:hypothetical protein
MTASPPLATGGMSPDGTTTVVRIHGVKIDPVDKKMLCSAMCKCDKQPNIGKDGKQLKQGCVSAHLKGLDKALDFRSNFKQELNYDMTQNPPSPITDSGVETKPHDYLPGWIGKYWGSKPEHSPTYKGGIGLIRRPDVVVVKDASKPPTQDNIKQIVEMKFPPDTLKTEQRDAYIRIAGDEKKLAKLEPSDCDCQSEEPKGPNIPVEELGAAAAVAAWVAYILSRGKTPRPPLRPVPGLVPAF